MAKSVIICVDDEKIVLDSLRKELRENIGDQFAIEVAESGAEALDMIREMMVNGHDLPLVISDYIMPELKGDEVLRQVKEINPDTYCIMLTGQATIEGVTNAINNAGLYRYIPKPWETNDLLLTINEALKSYNQDKEIKIKNEEILIKNKEITEINSHLEDLVRQRTEELEHKKQEIDESINYSRHIQMAIMGEVGKIEKRFPFTAILYLPKDVVSGDFYWYTQINQKIILVAADCTGHGVPGAFMSIVGMSALNQIVNEKEIVQPDKILNSLRKMLVNILSQTGRDDESKDGMDIAIIALDFDEMIMEYAGAFNSLYFIRDNFSGFDSKNNSRYVYHGDHLLEIKADRVTIGISDMMDKNYTIHRIKIKQNDVFYILTDGYFDQLGGPKIKKLLSKRFKDKIVEIKDKDILNQKKLLSEFIYDWKGPNEQVDDILIIGVKVPEGNYGGITHRESDFEELFVFNEEINRNRITDILDSIEIKLQDSDCNKLQIKKITIVLTELIQNSIHYFEKHDLDLSGKEFALRITKYSDFLKIECSNSINVEDYYNVKKILDNLNDLDETELHNLYKEQLSRGDLPYKHGAGLGFIVIAQRSKKPIKCEIENYDDNSYRMKITLDISIK
jgi:serine phosphatase RsbU (regulator of sigma subunit)